MNNALLAIHVLAGTIALLSGSVALVVRKGSRPHRRAGNAFFVSMLAMAATGAAIAYLQPLTLSVLGGMLTFYLVATGWLTIKRTQETIGYIEFVALAAVALITFAYFFVGIETARSETGLRDGFPAGPFYFFGCIAALATVFDIRLILRGGISGAQRIARHLWRMCFGLWIAAASFFIGQQQVFPVAIRESNVLYIPNTVITLIMIYWLVRTLFTSRSPHLRST